MWDSRLTSDMLLLFGNAGNRPLWFKSSPSQDHWQRENPFWRWHHEVWVAGDVRETSWAIIKAACGNSHGIFSWCLWLSGLRNPPLLTPFTVSMLSSLDLEFPGLTSYKETKMAQRGQLSVLTIKWSWADGQGWLASVSILPAKSPCQLGTTTLGKHA